MRNFFIMLIAMIAVSTSAKADDNSWYTIDHQHHTCVNMGSIYNGILATPSQVESFFNDGGRLDSVQISKASDGSPIVKLIGILPTKTNVIHFTMYYNLDSCFQALNSNQ
jgi:hypothetical protein